MWYKTSDHWWVVGRGGTSLFSETAAPGCQGWVTPRPLGAPPSTTEQKTGGWGVGASLSSTVPLGSCRVALPCSPSLPGTSCGHWRPWPLRGAGLSKWHQDIDGAPGVWASRAGSLAGWLVLLGLPPALLRERDPQDPGAGGVFRKVYLQKRGRIHGPARSPRAPPASGKSPTDARQGGRPRARAAQGGERKWRRLFRSLALSAF